MAADHLQCLRWLGRSSTSVVIALVLQLLLGLRVQSAGMPNPGLNHNKLDASR